MGTLANQILSLNLSIEIHPRGTDKSGPHSYIKNIYEPLFEITSMPASLLEIGIFGGASLVLWKSTFPSCEVIGFEIDPFAELHPKAQEYLNDERIIVHFVDAYHEGFDLVSENQFDLIIDDGPHTIKSQIKSLQYYDLLGSHGTLIIEDLYHSFWSALIIWFCAPIRVKRNMIFIDLFKVSRRKDDCVLLITKNSSVKQYFKRKALTP
jgi:hypothetical protein